MDVRERIVQEISEDGGGLAVLGEEQLDALRLGNFLPGRLPFLDKRLQLGHEDRGVLAFGRRADDGSVVLRENASDKSLKPSFLFL